MQPTVRPRPPRRAPLVMLGVVFALLAGMFALPAPARAATTIAQWTFEGDVITPSAGAGTAALVGGTTAIFAIGFSGVAPDRGWNTTSYPATAAGSKTAGVEYTISTLGFEDVLMTFAIRHSNTAANTIVVQYALGAGAFTDAQTFTFVPAATGTGDTWYPRAVDFSALPAIDDQASVRLRVVNAVDPGTGTYLASRSTNTYGSGGTMRFDNVVVSGNALTGAATSTPTETSVVPTNTPTETSVPATATSTSAPTETLTPSITSTPAPLCAAAFTAIPAIQGTGNAAMITGAVTTQGVVVGDYEGASPTLRGFYLQDAAGDGNSESSDAIFVFNNANNSVALGQVVRVTGTAADFLDQTQISATGIVDCGSTASVTPVDISLPVPAAVAGVAYLERFEGMLMRFTQTLYVTEMFQLGRFGQVLLSSGARLPQPSNIVEPGAAANAQQAANNLNKIILDDANNGQNQDPIIYGRGGNPLSASNTLRGGDTTSNVVGVLTYTWAGSSASGNAYRIRPVNALGASLPVFAATNPRPASPDAVGGTVKVTAFNVLNYFNSFGTTSCAFGVGGAVAECRGAENTTEFERQAAKTVAAMLNSGADIFGLMEIENDGYGTTSAIGDLVARLNAATAAGTYALIDPDAANGPNSLGTDAIKVGIIYKPGVVTLVGNPATLRTGAFGPILLTNGLQQQRNRPPLAQTFADANGGKFTLVVNHLKSKGSACTDQVSPIASDPDLGDGQGNCNQTRLAAAQQMMTWLATDPTASGDSDVLIGGDLNSYAKEDPIDAILAAGYVNLIESRLGALAYSYVFDGQWGYLDHALASSSLNGQVTGATEWHINADEPTVLDYNTNFKTAGQVASLYAPDQYRSSDHDAVIVGLNLTPPAAALALDAVVADDTITQGDTLAFALNYSTTQPTNLTLTFQLPDAMQFVSATPAPTSITVGGLITWNLGAVAAGNGSIALNVKSFNPGASSFTATLSNGTTTIGDSVSVAAARNGVVSDFVTLAAVASECNRTVTIAGECTNLAAATARAGRGTVAIIGVRVDGSSVLLNSFDTGRTTAEIPTFTPDRTKLLVTNSGGVDGSDRALLVIDITDPWVPTLLTSVPTPNSGEPSSVAVRPQGDYALVTVLDPTAPGANNGRVYRFDLATNTFDPAFFTVGPNPDSISIARNSRYALIANEADDSGAVGGPVGSFSVINLANGTVNTVSIGTFAANGYTDLTRVEPEYTAITPDSAYGIFTIQDPANDGALVVVDLATATITDIKRFTILGGGGSVVQAEPDGVAAYRIGTQNYVATANEEDQSVSIFSISTTGIATLLSSSRIEEYLPVPVDTTPGSSGSNGLGNTSGSPADDLSFPFDDGEPDPEGIDVTVIDGRAIAIVGMEETGAALVLDITNPAAITSLGLLRNLSADAREVAPGSDRKSFTGRPEGVAIAKTFDPIVEPTATPTNTAEPTATNTATSLPSATATSTNTPTVVPSTATSTSTNTATSLPSATATSTNTATSLPSATATSTNTATSLPSATATSTNTPTVVPSTATSTSTNTATVVPSTATSTSTSTATRTVTNTRTSTPTRTATPTRTSFPHTGLRDDFNRADGNLGSSWSVFLESYSILRNQVTVQSDGPINWNPAVFGPSQEAFVTLTNIDTRDAEHNLNLKVQAVGSRGYDALIEIQYDAKALDNTGTLQVATFRRDIGWVVYPSFQATFVSGDQLGARALADGSIQLYRNGVLLRTITLNADDQAYFNPRGGRIGVWFHQARRAIFDDFGGGTLP